MILSGRAGERCAPTDEAIAAFNAAMPHDGMTRALAGAARVGDIRCYERTANFRRRGARAAARGGARLRLRRVCALTPRA